MPQPFHVLAASARIVAVVMAGAALAQAQSSPVVFQGLPHTAVGNATLQLDSGRWALDINRRLMGAVGGQPSGAQIYYAVNICSWLPEQCRIATETVRRLPVPLVQRNRPRR